jgi:hypothetical protein
MRQVGDTLVWLGLIVVVGAVIYFTPRFASYLSVREKDTLDGLDDARARVVRPIAIESAFRHRHEDR